MGLAVPPAEQRKSPCCHAWSHVAAPARADMSREEREAAEPWLAAPEVGLWLSDWQRQELGLVRRAIWSQTGK